MHAVYRLTSVGRPVEPQYPTNLAILVWMGVALLGASAMALAYGQDLFGSAVAGVHAALVVFTAWALSREIAPDDQPAAFVAVAVVTGLWVFGYRPEVLGAFILVPATRIASRSTGLAPTLPDAIGLVLLAAYATWFGDWPVGIAMAVAFVANAALRPRDWRSIPFAVATLGIVAVTFARRPPPLEFPFGADLGMARMEWIVAAIIIAFMALAVGQGALVSKQDVGDAPLSKPRVQMGMAVTAIAAAGSLVRADLDPTASAVLWSAMLGTVLGRPVHLWRQLGKARLTKSGPRDEPRASDH